VRSFHAGLIVELSTKPEWALPRSFTWMVESFILSFGVAKTKTAKVFLIKNASST
jgi:hypothetical protein